MPTDAMNAKGDIFKMTFKVKDGVSVNQQIVMIVNEFVNAPVGGESTPQAFTTHNAIITISGAKDPEGGFNRGEEAVGAYICNSTECLKKAKKRKSIERAFSMKIDDSVYDEMEEEILNGKE